MDLWLHGASRLLVVAALQCKTSSGMCSVQGTGAAFAAILAEGSVVAWGHPGHGGDNSAVQDQLRNVQQVQGTRATFAAMLADGSVVTWGHPGRGGDSSAVQTQLREL